MQDIEQADLTVPVSTVCWIIERAHDLQGKSERTDTPGAVAEDDPEGEVLEDRGTDPVAEELTSAIEDLNEDEQVDLVALVWLGRDDDADWDEMRRIASDEHTAATASYLLGTPLLAEHLEAGLARLGHDCLEWEGSVHI